jgi:hypothetical protein
MGVIGCLLLIWAIGVFPWFGVFVGVIVLIWGTITGWK